MLAERLNAILQSRSDSLNDDIFIDLGEIYSKLIEEKCIYLPI